MKKKLLIFTVIGLLLIGATTVFAAEFKTPAQIYADLKGITEEEAIEERSTGSSYGTLAEEAGLEDEFKDEMLESKKSIILERVEEGRLTQEQADILIERFEGNIENCEGSGSCGNIGKEYGLGFGSAGRGNGMRGGNGNGMRDGSGFAKGGRGIY